MEDSYVEIKVTDFSKALKRADGVEDGLVICGNSVGNLRCNRPHALLYHDAIIVSMHVILIYHCTGRSTLAKSCCIGDWLY
jgi:hypothetical protein